MQQFRVPGLGYRLVLAVAGAAVALTAGFANPARRVLASVLHTRADVRPAAAEDNGNGSEAPGQLLYMLIALIAIIAVVTALA